MLYINTLKPLEANILILRVPVYFNDIDIYENFKFSKYFNFLYFQLVTENLHFLFFVLKIKKN